MKPTPENQAEARKSRQRALWAGRNSMLVSRMRVDLKKTLFILPNLFTLSSVFCGFFSMVISADAEPQDASAFHTSALLIVLAMFFDMVDGRVARLTKTQSAFGVQIDSLADVVSFGVAPALLVYRWSLYGLGHLGIFVSFVFVGCGAIRLARFNVMAMGSDGAPKKPSKYILGLPIPGAAGILVSLVVANYAVTGRLYSEPRILAGVVGLLAFFMVSTIRFRSFKDLKLNLRTMLVVLFAAGSSAFLAWRFHASFALVWLLICYLAIGVLEAAIDISKRAQERLARHNKGGQLTLPETPSKSERPAPPAV